ncbi:MAG: ceramidase domain-containing protein [Chitinophagales bacterium]|nr:ceramidase [Chitinophagales bacterium]MDW8273878.1 ceramidase domain-containing protein [Chitinophagales bacterium]
MTKIFARQLMVAFVISFAYAWAISFINNTYHNSGIWLGFPHYDGIHEYFCERTNMLDPIRQPVNTFTNVIYLLVSLYVFGVAFRDVRQQKRYNLISANPWYSFTYAFIQLYLFVVSSYFHAGLTLFGRDLDYSGVFSISLYPLMYFTHRVLLLARGLPSNGRHPKEALVLTITFTFLYIYFTFFLPPRLSRWTVLALILFLFIFAIIVEKRDPGRTNKLYMWLTIITISLAVMFFVFDNLKILCDPDSFIQPHGLWHLLSGVSSFYFYFYIRSEKNYTTVLANSTKSYHQYKLYEN